MRIDEDYKIKLNSTVPFYGQDWQVFKFRATVGL